MLQASFLALSEIGKPIDLLLFMEWKLRYENINQKIGLSGEPCYVFFNKKSIYNIIDGNLGEDDFLVARFKCDEPYNNLSVYLHLQKRGQNYIHNPVYKGHLAIGGLDTMVGSKERTAGTDAFDKRKTTFNEYANDKNGIALSCTVIDKFLSAIQEEEIKIWFVRGVVDVMQDRTTVVFSPVGFNGVINQPAPANDMDLYDHGTGCCPIP
jgi:hypothetical protein